MDKITTHRSPMINVKFSDSYLESVKLFDYFDNLRKEMIDSFDNGIGIDLRRITYERS